MNAIHFGAAVKVVQSKAKTPGLLRMLYDGHLEYPTVSRRFADYRDTLAPKDSVQQFLLNPNERLFVYGEDLEPVRAELKAATTRFLEAIPKSAGGYFKLRLGSWMHPFNNPFHQLTVDERNIRDKYLNKALAEGKVVDLDA